MHKPAQLSTLFVKGCDDVLDCAWSVISHIIPHSFINIEKCLWIVRILYVSNVDILKLISSLHRLICAEPLYIRLMIHNISKKKPAWDRSQAVLHINCCVVYCQFKLERNTADSFTDMIPLYFASTKSRGAVCQAEKVGLKCFTCNNCTYLTAGLHSVIPFPENIVNVSLLI